MKQLRAADLDLQCYEASAAPPGWTCSWHRYGTPLHSHHHHHHHRHHRPLLTNVALELLLCVLIAMRSRPPCLVHDVRRNDLDRVTLRSIITSAWLRGQYDLHSFQCAGGTFHSKSKTNRFRWLNISSPQNAIESLNDRLRPNK